MELLNTPTSAFLLNESLESLHRQSIEWLDTIAFWREETYFFYGLLVNKTFGLIPISVNEAINKVEDKIKKVSNEEIIELEKEVTRHERMLYYLMTDKREGDETYREAHKHIATVMSEFSKSFVQLKKQTFDLVKAINNHTLPVNDTLKTIYERRAVRKYKPTQVDQQLILQVLDAARMAPTAINRQPWKFYVVTRKEQIQAFSEAIAKISERYVHLKHPEIIATSLPEDPVFHHAPVVIFITSPKDNVWGGVDVGMCAQNMMLAAKSLGLDTCPVGFGKLIEQTALYPQLNIPDLEHILISITLGYGNDQPEPHERKKHNVFFVD